jgi:hypothetical protein
LEPLAAGDPEVVAGYRLRGRLGAGGMGRVFLALTPGGRPVALKMVRQELADDPDFRVRFRQEIAAARRVHGLFTAQVLDADPAGSPPWLVTAYVPGPSLAQAVADHGPLPPESVFLLVAGVAEALGVIHQAGVIHRDLKPSNVLLAGDGPRVIDFGIARAAEATSLTRTGMRVGSPGYMAPEQVRGAEVGVAADVFALGALAGFAATGRPPFGLGSEAAVLYRVLHEEPDLDGCPEALRSLLAGCLAKDPSVRPSPAALIEACRDQAAGKTVQFTDAWLPPDVAADLSRHNVGLGRAAAPRRRSRPAMIAGAAAAVVLLAGLTAWGVLAVASPGSRGGHAPAADALAGPSRHPRASPKTGASAATTLPSPASTLDPCVIGTWTATSEDIPGTLNGEAIVYAGAGSKQIFRPDGVDVVDYGSGTRYFTHDGGSLWTWIVKGAGTLHWETQGGQVYLSDEATHGSWELLENGNLNNSGTLTLSLQPERYTCTASTLGLFGADGTSIVMSREIPKTPSGS